MQDRRWLAQYDAEVQQYEQEHPQATAQASAPTDQATSRPKHPSEKLSQAQRTLLKNRALVELGPRTIAVHCTHGYNRSGYMLVQYAKRMCPTMSVATCLKQCVPSWFLSVLV